MEDNSDTDVNDTGMVAPRTTVVQDHEEMKFEVMANKLRFDQENQGNLCTDYSHVSATESTTNHENIVQIISTETLNFDQILANQKILFEKIDNMLQIQAITLENQQKIVQKLARQSVQLEEISVQLAEIKEGPSVTFLKDANPVDNESFTLKPIENQRDLISLDQLLVDRAEKNKLKRHLAFLCSASKGEGKTCAFKLLDILFTRDFLCNCSWAGGSRGDMSKIALKDYKNVLKFFHGMIQTWDPTYTVQDNETFFKIITKNSKQRKSMKNLRTSSKRCRKNKDNLDKQQKSENKIQPNDDKETERESMQIQDYAPNNDSIEITEGESMHIQEQKKEKENIYLNNMSDDDIEGGLC
ncbi:hypothetical protein PYW07_000822 [Mythimna separata]|uniref:DUF4806 domain-containing protein n=1 Tax=Mythimna separata TaxID=271217 RepID=A0AAD7YSC8_MYTSE|nr:hypothetical protein PYW07_000822 [Mythimna separata]